MKKFNLTTIETMYLLQIIATVRKAECTRNIIDIDEVVETEHLIFEMLDGDMTDDMSHIEIILSLGHYSRLMRNLKLFRRFCTETSEVELYCFICEVIDKVVHAETI